MRMPKKFADIALEWLSTKEGSVKPSSYSAYASTLTGNILPVIGEVEELSESDIQNLQEKLQAAGVKKTSLRNYIQLVKAIIGFGAEKGYCTYPLWLANLHVGQGNYGSGLILLTPEQEQKLIGHLLGNPTPRNIGIFLSLVAGLKFSEVCALKWGAIDTRKGQLYVVDSKNKRRSIPLPKSICGFLAPIAKERDKADYVCTGTSVLPRRPKTLTDGLKALARSLNLPVITFQDLRHTFAVRAIQAGCDLVTLMELLGISEPGPLFELYGKYIKTAPKAAMEGRVNGISPLRSK